MRSSAFLLAASMLLPLAGQAAKAQEALAQARKQVEAADYRMTGRLVRVDKSGARTNYGIQIKALWSSGTLRVLLEVTSPTPARARVLLEMRPGEKNTIQIAHPGGAAATVLPFDEWNQGPRGEEFSYEDFLDSWYFWAGQTDMGRVKFGARNCDLVRSTPGARDKTHYAEVKSWLDLGSGFPVYMEKTVKGSGNVKEFTSFGLRRTEGIWSATQVEAKIRGHAGSTLLIIDHGSAKAHLGLKDFSAVQLNHF